MLIPREHAYSVSMVRPRRCGWFCIELILCLFPVAPIFVQSTSSSTNFSYPVFRSAEDFLTFGEIQHSTDTLSFTVNPIPYDLLTTSSFCVKLLHKEKVRMKNRESSAVASFSTSFTFSVTKSQEQFTNRTGWIGNAFGITFNFVTESISALFIGHADPGSKRSAVKYFAMECDSYNDPVDNDPSDAHIGININNPKSIHTYNLCEGERTSCSLPWSNQHYTAWIDYNGSTQSLEVWFANGSLANGAVKPVGSGLIQIPELDLMDVFEEYMYIGFAVNIGGSLDTHDITSWNFASYFEEELTAPTSLPSRSFAKRNAVMIGAVCSTAISVAAISLLGCYWRRQRHLDKSEPGLGLELLMGLRRFTFKELKKATNNFNDGALLGKGGSGSVYKGTLTSSGMVVAVKRLKHDSEHVRREFLAEVSSISQIRHRNLVHLQGWCHEDGHFLLVFDYMSNGSLDEWLFPGRRRFPSGPKHHKTFEALPWELRFSILAGVAAAVEYLHEEWVQIVLHRDIKSSNVMLDADFNPYLGDFGLARLMDHKKSEKTTVLAGTFGYMAPEMHYTGKATKESDMYSFGILMLEVLCGRKPVNLQVEDPDEEFMLVQKVWRAHEGGNILGAVDPELLNLLSHQFYPSSSSTATSNESSQLNNSICEPLNEISSDTSFPVVTGTGDKTFDVRNVDRKIVPLLQLGLQCCLLDPESRPSMRVVKQVILKVQGSTGEDTMTILSSMAPLPSTMPVYGFALQVPESSMNATKAPSDNGEASFVQRSDTMSVLRRRLQSE